MRIINWGILGAGAIAHKFATALTQVENASLYAVGSRTLEKAEEFKQKFNAQIAYGTYEDLASDPNIDVIYIATPHPFHKQQAILCIQHDKAILCEKPFTLNAKDAKEVYDLAKEKQVFVMEAMWTKCLPITKQVLNWIQCGAIGEVKMVKADFSINIGNNPTSRLMDINLGGGALLDLGVYPITYATMILGTPREVSSMVHIGRTHVDEQSVVMMKFNEDQMAIATSAASVEAPHDAYILGSKGKIHIPSFWNAEKAFLYEGNNLIDTATIPFKTNGYEYEIEEVCHCLRTGKLESELIPMSDTIKNLEIMDELRKKWNLVYPME